MPNNPPYREYCDTGPAPTCGHGPLHKHGRASENNITRHVDTTVVDNWDTEAGGTIPAYERWTQDLSGGGSCEVHFCVEDGAPCAAWPVPFTDNVFGSTPSTKANFGLCRKSGFKNVQAKRNWHGVLPWIAPETGCFTDFCDDGFLTGFQAYQPVASQSKYLTWTPDVHVRNNFNLGGVDNQKITADKTGYRTINALSGKTTASTFTTYEEDSRITGGTFSGGEVTGGTFFIDLHTDGGAGYTDTDGDGTHDTDFASGGVTILDDLDNDLHCGYPLFRTDLTDHLPGFIVNWNGFGHSVNLPLMTDPNSYSAHITADAGLGGSVYVIDIEFSRSATVVSWDFSMVQYPESDPSGANTNTWHYYGSLTLSDANTGASVYSDIKTNLLSLWPLNDDALYPWRKDLKVGVAPLVSRKEVATNVSPIAFNTYTVDDLSSPIDDAVGNHPFDSGWTPTWGQIPWFDPVVYIWKYPAPADLTETAANVLIQQYDGSILGAPMPAGYEDYFDFGFIDMRGCCYRPPDNPGFQTWSWYQLGWGMAVGAAGMSNTFNDKSASQLPRNSTQWNNWFQAINKPAGAWIFHSDQSDYFGSGCVSSGGGPSKAGDSGSIVAQKWAETVEEWSSQNFAMPAGDAKFWFDELRVYCAVNDSGSGEGSTWTLTELATSLPPADIDLDDIWGGPVVDGFYAITDYDSGTGIVTLGTKQFDVPSNWESKSDVGAIDLGDGGMTDADSCFGPLRWPDSPSLLGRAAVTVDAPGTTMTFAVPQPAFGMDARIATAHQEQVDIFAADMSSISSDVTATRTSDTEFTIGSTPATAAWCMIHGSPKWYMNDSDPKGDFTILEWTSDFRSFEEYGRLAGVLDCDSAQVAQPTTNAGGGPVGSQTQFTSFSQRAGCLPFNRCAPKVICFSPNGETFINGSTSAFPATFTMDEQYGSKWWGKPETTMTDLLWQPPHRPCNIETCAEWLEDGGFCEENVPGSCPSSEESPAPKYFYMLRPHVEARLTIPANYGNGQDETGPDLPDGVQIGWLSPVDHDTGDVALPPVAPGAESDTGRPGGAHTAGELHETLCANVSCRFDNTPPDCGT